MNDQNAGEKFEKLQVPLSYEEANSLTQKVLFALAEIGGGQPVDVVRKLEELEPDAPNKEIIAKTHLILTELYSQGAIKGDLNDGSIIYHIQP